MMAPPTVGRKPKLSGRAKVNMKSLKRKRDIEDHEKLEKAVEELVSITTTSRPTNAHTS
jgi:ATP-dependent RNA helicase DDX10/DBP4